MEQLHLAMMRALWIWRTHENAPHGFLQPGGPGLLIFWGDLGQERFMITHSGRGGCEFAGPSSDPRPVPQLLCPATKPIRSVLLE